MSESIAQVAAPAVAAAPPPGEVDLDAQAEAIAALISGPAGAPKRAPATEETKPLPKVEQKATKEPEHLAAANGRKAPNRFEDPLNESDFAVEKLNSPDAVRAAAERVIKARREAAEFMRAAHRSHAAAEQREKKQQAREMTTEGREKRVEAWERAISTAIDDMESGDGVRFLTAVGKLSKSGDPAGFWRNASLSLAKGEPYSLKEKQAIAADPELKARLEQLEQTLHGRDEQEHARTVEQLKDRNLEAARKNEATPRVIAYAADERTAAAVRERLATIMMSAHRQHGRAIDISQACEILESELSVHFELSQRADGKTNGEKETTGPAPDAGRETSRELPPKPETSQATIPAALSSAPASAHRSMNEEEQKQSQIRQLDAIGFFD
jgi:hypothetical protein